MTHTLSPIYSRSLFNIINCSHLAYFKYQLKIINFNEYVNILECFSSNRQAQRTVFFSLGYSSSLYYTHRSFHESFFRSRKDCHQLFSFSLIFSLKEEYDDDKNLAFVKNCDFHDYQASYFIPPFFLYFLTAIKEKHALKEVF